MKRVHVMPVAVMTGALAAALVLGQEFVAGQAAPAGPAAQAGQPAAAAQPRAAQVPLKGKIERLKIYGKSLAGNLMGESDSPYVSIYLPQSYATEKTRRYPVIYFLHGYGGEDSDYMDLNGGGR